MTEDAPDLESYLNDQPYTGYSPCSICRFPAEIREQIEAAVVKAREADLAPKWAAIERWVKKKMGSDALVNAHRLSRHFERNHHVR